MTTETRILIQPQDIIGIEFLCAACGVRFSYDDIKQANGAFSTTCPTCKNLWLAPAETDHVWKFLSGLIAMQGSSALGKMVRLRLAVHDGEV